MSLIQTKLILVETMSFTTNMKGYQWLHKEQKIGWYFTMKVNSAAIDFSDYANNFRIRTNVLRALHNTEVRTIFHIEPMPFQIVDIPLTARLVFPRNISKWYQVADQKNGSDKKHPKEYKSFFFANLPFSHK